MCWRAIVLKEKAKVAIIGGGVAGSTTAIALGERGLNVTLFEKESDLVSGPPFCHLHAGGNLYREISDEQCLTLLKQSIDFLNFYPFAVDHRPTVIVLPTTDKKTPKTLLPRLNLLVQAYQSLIEKDSKNKVLGEAENYYRVYEKEAIEALRTREIVTLPQSADEWMIPVAKNIDLNKVQFPLIMVQEYGLNLFSLAAGAMLSLKALDSVTIHTDTSVENIEKQGENWNIHFTSKEKSQTESFDYIINATGFRTGKIDDMVGAPCKRMVEFKAAYVSKWDNHENILFPEIIFHGERGTPQGMGQFTPYPNGYFQLHGMTKEITLYEDGLVASTPISCQPQLGSNFIEKIENTWEEKETKERTNLAIQHLSNFIPDFSTATVGSKPLFGAQQIPGDDPTLRVAEVSFPLPKYARCEIVKVSSVIDMIDTIIKEFIKLNYLDDSDTQKEKHAYLKDLSYDALETYAQRLALSRNYPASLAKRNITPSPKTD